MSELVAKLFPEPVTAILRNGGRVDVVGFDPAGNLLGEGGEAWSREGRANDDPSAFDIVGRVDDDGRVFLTQPKL